MRKIFSAVLAVGSLLSAPMTLAETAQGFEVTISHSVFTYHTANRTFEDKETGQRRPWNEDNGFTGLRWEINDHVGFGVGFGENSFYEDSLIGEVEVREPLGRFKGGQFDLGANLLLASGYEQEVSGGIMAGINPFIRYRKDWGGAIKLGTLNFVTTNIILEYSF